ncbi:hypothetical protein MXB_2520 [Myxobolus squamalis]|nr:hypothetical protein MXB_2520 [Myxobolus squamalis]
MLGKFYVPIWMMCDKSTGDEYASAHINKFLRAYFAPMSDIEDFNYTNGEAETEVKKKNLANVLVLLPDLGLDHGDLFQEEVQSHPEKDLMVLELYGFLRDFRKTRNLANAWALYTKERDLKDMFRKCGSIEECTIVYDRRTGRSRGFGFVRFKYQEDADEARELMNGKEFDSRKIRVDYSVTQRPHSPTPDGILLDLLHQGTTIEEIGDVIVDLGPQEVVLAQGRAPVPTIVDVNKTNYMFLYVEK